MVSVLAKAQGHVSIELTDVKLIKVFIMDDNNFLRWLSMFGLDNKT